MTIKGEETKKRLIDATIDLLKEKGYNGVGLQEIIRAGATPKGSLYFHFPGGKEELVTTALQFNGREISDLLHHVFLHITDIRTAARTIIDFFISELESSDYKKGCPVATTATDAAGFSDRIRKTCMENFKSWEYAVAQGFQKAGMHPMQADVLATLFISSVEGAIVLSQAYRDTEPLRRVADRILTLLPE